MRNLKRALSLGLTAAMISGLLVMGSSAVSYADVTSENNVEAIEVLQAVGVMVGDEDGNFNPDEYVTRNEMAVVMSNLLALNVSNFTSSSIPFTDVPDWAAPYVAACYADGITSGTSDTTYGGDDTVTAAQAGLMMLKALGYFQYSSDFGSDWQLAAVRQASSIDLYDGIDASASTAMTRNEVAQLALNALEATMVEASSDGSTVVVGDITVSSNVSYDERTTSSTSSQYTAISDDEIDGNYTIELGEDLYDGDLEKRSSDTNSDVFGRPAITWEYQNDEIGTYADDPEETYTEGVDKDVLYDLIGSSVYNDLEDGEADLTVYLDGEILTKSDVDAASVLDAFFFNGEDDDADYTGRGVLTEVFVDDDNNVTITMIRTYVAQVDGDYDADNEELILATLDGTLDIPVDTLTLSSDDFNNLDQFADEDYVLITAAEDEVQTIEAAEVITATVTAYTVGSNVTADGSRYYYNYTYTQARNDDRTESVTYDPNDDYTLVLDNYGYVVYSDGSEGVEDYVYVADMADTTGVRSEIEAEAYFVDGTNEVITIDSVNAYNDSDRLVNVDADDYLDDYFGDYDNGAWYIYDEQSDGDYELTEVDEDDFRAGAVTEDGVEVTSTGSATVYYGDNSTLRANSATVFVVNDDDDVSVYTGIREVPDITARASEKGDVIVAAVMDGNYAEVVYIDATYATISGMSDDHVYILDDNPDASTDSDDNDYYEFDAIVNGEVGTIMTTDDNYSVGLYTDVSYDENDYVDDMQPVENDYEYEDFVAYVIDDYAVEYEDDVIAIGDVDIVLADGYTIFYNDDGDAETWTASRLEREFGSDFDGIIYVFEDDDDQAVEIYVEGSGSGSSGSSSGSSNTSSRIVVDADATTGASEYDYELTVTKRNSSSALTLDEALDAIEDYFDDENLTVVERNIVSGDYVYEVENSRGFSYTYVYEFDANANEVTIYVNGDAVDVPDGTTLGDLAKECGNWMLGDDGYESIENSTVKVTQGARYTIHSKVTLNVGTDGDGTELYGEVGEAVDMTELAGNWYYLNDETTPKSVATAITFDEDDQTVDDGYVYIEVYFNTGDLDTDSTTYVKAGTSYSTASGTGTGYIYSVGDSDFAYVANDGSIVASDDVVIRKGYVAVTYTQTSGESNSYSWTINSSDGYALANDTLTVEYTISGLRNGDTVTVTFSDGSTDSFTATTTSMTMAVDIPTGTDNISLSITGVSKVDYSGI